MPFLLHPLSRHTVVLAALLLNSCLMTPVSCLALDDAGEKRRFFFSGFESEREKVLSGIVRGTGERAYTYPDGEVIKGSNETLLIAFDYSKGLMRVDRKIPRRLPRSESRELQDTLHRFFIRMPEYDVCAVRRESKGPRAPIWITKPEWPLTQNAPAYPFDIRAISFIRSSFYWSRPTPLDQYLAERLPPEFTEYEDEGNGLHRFTYTRIEPPDARDLSQQVTIWIDKNRGYSIVKTRYEFIVPKTPDEPWKVMCESQTTWDDIGEIWVPVSHAFKENVNVNEGKPCLSVKMGFDWESVNEPVPEKYFSLCDFGFPAQVPIQDARKAKGRISEAVLFSHVDDMCSGPKQMPENQHRSNTLRVALALSGLLLIAIAGIWTFLKREKPKS